MNKLFILLFIACITSCTAQKKKNGVLHPQQIKMEASSCFGRCKAEHMTINKNLLMEYEGIKNVPNIGNYYATITADDYKNLLILFNKKKFTNLDAAYLSNIADLQKFSLTLGNKTIEFQERNAPEELKEILTAITTIIEKYTWTPKSN